MVSPEDERRVNDAMADVNRIFQKMLKDAGLAPAAYMFWKVEGKTGKVLRMFGYTTEKVRDPKTGREGYESFEGRPGHKKAWRRVWRRQKDARDAAFVRYVKYAEKRGALPYKAHRCEVCEEPAGYYPEQIDGKRTCLSCQRKRK